MNLYLNSSKTSSSFAVFPWKNLRLLTADSSLPFVMKIYLGESGMILLSIRVTNAGIIPNPRRYGHRY